VRVGWALSALVIVFLIVDAAVKLVALPVATESGAELGFPGAGTARLLGVILLGCTIVYAVPRTAVLGAVLLTGYLGGTVATQMRVDAPLFSSVLSGSIWACWRGADSGCAMNGSGR
jgi:hypothetical protein